MERKSQQEQHHIFQHYLEMDPESLIDRCFLESKCISLAQDIFLAAQRLELLSNKIRTVGE